MWVSGGKGPQHPCPRARSCAPHLLLQLLHHCLHNLVEQEAGALGQLREVRLGRGKVPVDLGQRGGKTKGYTSGLERAWGQQARKARAWLLQHLAVCVIHVTEQSGAAPQPPTHGLVTAPNLPSRNSNIFRLCPPQASRSHAPGWFSRPTAPLRHPGRWWHPVPCADKVMALLTSSASLHLCFQALACKH